MLAVEQANINTNTAPSPDTSPEARCYWSALLVCLASLLLKWAGASQVRWVFTDAPVPAILASSLVTGIFVCLSDFTYIYVAVVK